MAQTYTARTAGPVAFASNKSMISIYNITASSRVVRIYRMWAINAQVAAVATGPISPLYIQRLATATPTGGTAITPATHDSTNESLAGLVDCRTGFTGGAAVVANTIYRQVLVTVDEPAVSALTPDEYWTFTNICELFNAGYKDSNVEPIVLRPQEGIEIRQPGTNALGLFEFNITFTVAGT